MKKRVGILGGTFNPPHIGHLIIANEVYHALGLEEIRFMPNAIPPHKKMDFRVTGKQRITMLELAIGNCSFMKVEDVELKKGGTSYTFDTIELLRQREPDSEFFFIIGGDQVEYLPNWYRIDELVQIVQLVGVARPQTSLQTAYPIKIVEIPQIDVSSTEIRRRFENGNTTKYLVPDAVREYIEREKLYEI